MSTVIEEGVEDVEEAVAAGRPVRDHGPYLIKVGDAQLDYRTIVMDQPAPTGRQILVALGDEPIAEYVLFRVLADGLMEQVELEEHTDLRSAGAEKFLVFHTSVLYRFELNGRPFEWGAAHISGRTLKKLAGVDAVTHDVFEFRHGEERRVHDKELIDLAKPGLERFATRGIDVLIVVNTRDRHVHKHKLGYWEVVRLAKPDAAPSPEIVYTVTYSHGPHQNPQGNLQDHESVFLKDGMVFDVFPTDRS